ncbi:hypothetical protein ZWY2020_002029 [Hordeum vulgare]|nr:hypothetical protein ZWY2020_002029 [Hordeum vulgare]
MKPLSASLSFVLHLASFLVLLLHQPHLLAAQRLTAGSTLSPPGYITSPSGGFAFGFRALDNDPSQFLLAVWFNFNLTQGPDPAQEKVVWYAKNLGSGSAVMATKLSVFSIGPQLTLTDNTGSIIWTNPYPSLQAGSILALQDSGNLQLLATGGMPITWESFQHPTDTLLPGQSLGSGKALLSRRSDMVFFPGRYSLQVQGDGNIVLYLTNLATGNLDSHNAYWSTSTNQPDNQVGNSTIFFDSSGHLFYRIINDSTARDLIPPHRKSRFGYHQYASLDPDGIFRMYTRPKSAMGTSNVPWAVTGQFPAEGCKIKTSLQGLCGPNSYCVYGPNDCSTECLRLLLCRFSAQIEILLHNDDDAIEDLVRVERFVRVALWCIEQNPSLRPTMHQVVQMLEGVVEVDTLPAPTSSNSSSPLTSSVKESTLLPGGVNLEIE